MCEHKNLIRNLDLFKETGDSRLLLFLNTNKIYAEIYTCEDCGEMIAKQIGVEE